MGSRLLAFLSLPAWLLAQNPAVTIAVDTTANRHAINPNVYGVAYATTANLLDLNAPLNRYGGNNTSRYNWQVNGDNRGSDWYFESIGDSSSTAGERGDTFISNSRSGGARALITIPMVGYVARLGASRSKLAGFSIAKYGAQSGNDWQWFPDAGNGVAKATGAYITGNDPNDADVAANSSFQAAWVQHLVSTWGTAANNGLLYYILDNEPSLWHSTHRDVHPTGATMDEIKSKMADYASQVKLIDPGALVAGPEEWGWSGYFYSGYDQQYGSLHGWSNLPDRAAHSGADYLPWLLSQLKQTQVAGGLKPLDVFSVHYYPQGGEFGNDTSAAMQLLRNQSTRSLWDPNYVDQSWINDKVQLIPRLRNWVNAYYYPGTPIAITEYNWGAEAHINGATTQADIYGIFGREGLDMATRWTTPDPSTPTYKAMKLYRNYDGNHSTFGDTSVLASVPDPDNLAAYAAVRSSDGALTLMVISKVSSGNTPVTVSLAGFTGNGTAQAWQLTSSNAIARLADLNYSGSLAATVPPQSITLFVMPAGTANIPPVAALAATPSSGIAPLAVTLDASASHDPDGRIVTYTWAFGDGGTAAGAAAITSHTYTSPGTYTAKVTVTDNSGATASATTGVTATTDPDAIAAPSNLTGDGLRSVAYLAWKDNSNNEQGFHIERAPAAPGPFTVAGTVGAGITSWSERIARGTYFYRVQAYNQSTGRVSAYSNVVTVRVK
ncbi:MAG TPA: glycoside hydrolase family 44 protein [Bryobacteraceae bacterium]|nr:glycoside hydrolase family 44 protein [Bryobacteraceae bacterium]